mgnify:CR=1 FL=1
MGNSQGGFKEYWDIIRKYPKYQGGFIWDFVDQSIRWTGKNGKMIYAYAGDFNRMDDSGDKNFCNNGLISLTANRIACVRSTVLLSEHLDYSGRFGKGRNQGIQRKLLP